MSTQETGLKRQIGLFGAVSILVGAVIGSGIFMTPGTVAAAAGSFGPFMIAWVLAGASGILCALVYSELAPAMPEAGGPYVYITEAFGKPGGFVYGWSMTIGNYIPLVAMLATGFATNLAKLIPGITPTGIKMIATAIILALMILNICGTKLGSTVANIFTVGKLLALILVIVGGFVILSPENFTTVVPEAESASCGVLSAAFPAFLAFGGYYQLAYMAGDIKDPKKTLPKALIIGMLIVIAINILISVACVGSVGFAALAGSETPVVDAGTAIFGQAGTVIVTIGACVSIFGALNGGIMSYPRVTFSMSQHGLMFKSFGRLHSKFNTPYVPTLFICLVALIFVWTGSFSTLLAINVFAGRILECVVCLSLLVLRKKKPDLERPLKMPGYPVTTVLAIVITLAICLTCTPTQMLQSIGLMATSIPAYFVFHALSKRSA
ncbi:APC family permease [Candidatus Allofournierella merdipullorum]|uniref:APC family permease n=1 Tax=Candidatus Allofournierella merdipullorum TaxID=2838595 RepID=UPI003AB57004